MYDNPSQNSPDVFAILERVTFYRNFCGREKNAVDYNFLSIPQCFTPVL